VEEFWRLTPRETQAVFEAAQWRWETEQRSMRFAVWHVAALQRAKKMPSLREFVGREQPKPLTAAEKEARRKEFEELKERMEHG
jgi:hypothetical protein